MTVAEIKEFANRWLKSIEEDKRDIENILIIKDKLVGYEMALKNIKSMLDELDRPKAKWEIDGHHRRCKKCGEYFCIDDREGDEIPHNFCGNCGARMEVENDTTPTII